MKYLLGFDIGSSSVKATLLEINSGKAVASAFSPSSEMPMQSSQPGFAEQDPEMWWTELVNAMDKLHQQASFNGDEVAGIGIAYQMHGLVCVNKNLKPLRPRESCQLTMMAMINAKITARRPVHTSFLSEDPLLIYFL